MMLLHTNVVSEPGTQTTATHQVLLPPHLRDVNPKNPGGHSGY